jgi:glutamate-1-semialdehyde aminotransferase
MLLTEKPIRNYGDFAAYETTRNDRWAEAALRQGIFQMADGRWYVSLAHTEDDVALTLEKARRAMDSLSGGGKL